jgi:hypothetical protein
MQPYKAVSPDQTYLLLLSNVRLSFFEIYDVELFEPVPDTTFQGSIRAAHS